MGDMADRIVKLLVTNKGKKMTTQEMLDRIDDNLVLAALAISEELADATRNEDGAPLITLKDRMQSFKELNEFRMKQARINKMDPHDKDKGADGKTPTGIAGYQNDLKDAKDRLTAKVEAGEAPEVAERLENLKRTRADGEPDKRHENSGRPIGQTLKARQEKIRRQQERLRRKDAPAQEEIETEDEE